MSCALHVISLWVQLTPAVKSHNSAIRLDMNPFINLQRIESVLHIWILLAKEHNMIAKN